MKKHLTQLLQILFFFSLSYVSSTAQDININFTANLTIDEVIATNLATNESITIPGDATLALHSLATVVNEPEIGNAIWVAPNPYNSYTNLHILNDKLQNVIILMANMSGKLLAQYEKELSIGMHTFQIAADRHGVYLLSVKSESGINSLKIVQNKRGRNNIEYNGNAAHVAKMLKSVSADYELDYTPGDIISYTITSGDYTTIVNETPEESKTIIAYLYECKDGDGNNYPIVKIGTQTSMAENLKSTKYANDVEAEPWLWMAENLKTTKYADGTAIPLVTDDIAWAVLGDNNTDKAYCFCNNDASLGGGALYTYAAAVNGTPHDGTNPVQGICPKGWHLPSDAEWTALVNYLIANGYNYDGTTSGDKTGKSLASTIGWSLTSPIGWRNSSIVGTIGNSKSTNNSTGFSALPGGLRLGYNDTYSFTYASYRCYWWSSTEYSSSWAYGRVLCYDYPDLRRHSSGKSFGFSVRCVRD